MSKNKILDLIIGDVDKWKRVPTAIRETREDLKTNKKWGLIGIFIACLVIVYLGMQGLRWVQNNSQYCEVVVKSYGNNYGNSYGALPIPISNQSWAYYLNYYKSGRKQSWVGFKCEWDFKRFCKEHGICQEKSSGTI